jgi:hypothetical protein
MASPVALPPSGRQIKKFLVLKSAVMCSICVGVKTGNILSGENQVVSFKNMNFQSFGFRHFGRLMLLPFGAALCYVIRFAAVICLYTSSAILTA